LNVSNKEGLINQTLIKKRR